jgi:hypothetical protein
MRERPAPLVSLAGAFLLAAVAVVPALVAMRTSPGFPVQAFTVDDGLYLQRAIGAWQGQDPYQWTYFENAGTRPLAEVAVARPNAVTDIAVGWIAATLGLGPAGLAIFLDWSCGALCLALFAAIFRRLCPWCEEWVVWSAAIVSVAFPSILVPDPLIHLPNAAFPFLVSQGFVDHAPPVFRAVYTQASYPLFLLSVLQMIRVYLRPEQLPGTMFLAGVLGGLCGFGYFFPWLTTLALGLSLPLLRAIVSRDHTATAVAGGVAIFFAGWLAGSIGVLAIMKASSSAGIVTSDLLARYWWLPIERVALAAVLLVAAAREARRDAAAARVTGFLALLVALEIPLMNVQPVVRQGLAPYHFPSFYLYPLLSGLGFLVVVEWLRRRFSLPLFARAVCALPVLAYVFDAALGVHVALQPLPLARDLGWLVERLRAEPPETVFAMNPVREPFSDHPADEKFLLNLPNFVSMLSGRYTLQQEWMFQELADTSDLERELGMSFLLKGRTQPLWKPPELVPMPGDMFTLTWTYLLLRREQKLALHKDLFRDYSACRFFQKFRVDILVHDVANDGPLFMRPTERLLTKEASSPEGTFDLYRFDRSGAVAKFCQGDGHGEVL